MKLSIVIVNWNSKHYLRDCLGSLLTTCREIAPQIVVVDGGSFDGCGEMLALEFPEIEFVQSTENIGFGRSNNLGFDQVTGDAVLLLNPDTVVQPGAIQILLQALQEEPESGIIGARLLNGDGTLQESSVHPLPTPWNTACDSDWLRRRWWVRHGPPFPGSPRKVEAVSGACMMMRSSLFRRIGGFSPQYFMYAEDMDLCLKVQRAGLAIYHAPNARVVHHGGGSSRTQFSKFSAVMIREALNVYMRLNHGPYRSGLYRLLQGISAILRMAILAPLWMISVGQNRQAFLASLCKWWVVLRWSFGLESWAREQFCSCESSTNGILEQSPEGV